MPNFFAIANESLDRFLRADGTWSEDMDDAEHLTIEQAVEKQVDLIRREIITEIFEIPMMAQAMYDDIHGRIDDLQSRLESAGIALETHIGQGDETTWTFTIPAAAVTLKITLAGPDTWEVSES
jgi:chromosome segregation ATPase